MFPDDLLVLRCVRMLPEDLLLEFPLRATVPRLFCFLSRVAILLFPPRFVLADVLRILLDLPLLKSLELFVARVLAATLLRLLFAVVALEPRRLLLATASLPDLRAGR